MTKPAQEQPPEPVVVEADQCPGYADAHAGL
jgi:hypothetical protein